MSQHSNVKSVPDTDATLKALRRAARRARELGARTGTPVYVVEGNRVVDLTKRNAEGSGEPAKPHGSRKSK